MAQWTETLKVQIFEPQKENILYLMPILSNSQALTR